MEMTMPLNRYVMIPALIVAGSLLVAPAAFAKVTEFSFKLTGQSETPPNDSKGSGAGTARYDDQTHVLSWNITYQGLSSPVTAAHFHGPAQPGESAPHTIAIPDDKLASPIIGSATLTDEQAKQLLGNQWYFNVHSKNIPKGELRGEVRPAAK